MSDLLHSIMPVLNYEAAGRGRTEDDRNDAGILRPPPIDSTTASMSASLKLVIIILACITLAFGLSWFILKTRARLRRNNGPEFMIFESDVSIEFGDEGEIIDVFPIAEEAEGRASFETILSSASPRRVMFDPDKLPAIIARRKGSLLDRRGRGELACDTSAFYHTDAVPTPSATLSGGKRSAIFRPVLGFNERGESKPLKTPTTASPFWSKMAGLPLAPDPPKRHPREHWT